MIRIVRDRRVGSIRRRSAADFLCEQGAASTVETAFVLAAIVLAAVAAISALGLKNRDIWANVAGAMEAVM